MKRKTGICFLLGTVFATAVIVVGIGFYNSQKRSPMEENNTETTGMETEAEEAVISSVNQPEYKYIIFSEDGRLVVYFSDNATVFFNSGIRADTLPDTIQEQLSLGIRFATDEQLYDFLESYSS